jgi:hypothetical protein
MSARGPLPEVEEVIGRPSSGRVRSTSIVLVRDVDGAGRPSVRIWHRHRELAVFVPIAAWMLDDTIAALIEARDRIRAELGDDATRPRSPEWRPSPRRVPPPDPTPQH